MFLYGAVIKLLNVCAFVSFHVLVLCCFLLGILLTTVLTFPALSTDTLLCYFCPLHHKSKGCRKVITTQCLPDQVCSSSKGHFGPVHVMSSQGCVKRELCGSHEFIFHRGAVYNVSHNCCCRDTCNSPLKSDTNLKKLLEEITDTKNPINVTIPVIQPFDSCVNYTSPVTAVPASR